MNSKAKGLPSAVGRARAAGLLIDFDELRVTVPAQEDAGPIIGQAYAQLSKVPGQALTDDYSVANAVLTFRSTAAERAAMQASLRQLQPFLNDLRRAAQRPRLSVNRAEWWNDDAPYSQTSVLSLGVLVLAAQALMAGEGHRLAEAESALRTAVRLMRLMDSERTGIAGRRRQWAEIRIQRAVVRTVQFNVDNPEAVRFLSEMQTALGPVPSVKWTLAGDLALALESIRRRKPEPVEQLPMADAVKGMARAELIDVYTETYLTMPDDPSDLAGIQHAFEQMEKESYEHPIYGAYARGFPDTLFTLKDVITRRRLAKIAQLILADRARGQMPTRLPDLGRDAIDPHSGKPFGFIRNDREVRVYSVGRDGLDDKGLESPPLRAGFQTRDVVFAIPLPGHRR